MTDRLLAAVDISKQIPWGDKTLNQTFPTASSLISVILKNSFTVVSLILVVLLIFGGLMFIIGAGEQDPKKSAQGKAIITDALIGFVITIFAYSIVQIIQIITGIPILNSTL